MVSDQSRDEGSKVKIESDNKVDRNNPSPLHEISIATLKSFGILLERFGWPAVVFYIIYSFIDKYATLEQKQRIIDKYILGDGFYDFPGIALCILLPVITLFIQHVRHRSEVKIKDEEIERLSKWKSENHHGDIGSSLSHGQGSIP